MLYKTEMFAHFVYSPDLSYHDLLEAESDLQESAMSILEDLDATYINFNAMGDTLRVQCVFREFEEELFHNLCDKIAPLMNGTIEGRILFVDKSLDVLNLYFLSDKKYKESTIDIPVTEPIGKRLEDESLDLS